MAKRVLFLVLTLGLLGAGVIRGETSLTDKAVGIWHFDEGAGTEAKDASVNEHDGLLGLEDEEPIWVEGRFGKGLEFSKEQLNRVSIPDREKMNPEQITLAAWIKPSEKLESKIAEIICKQWDAGEAGYRLRVHWSKISFSIGDGNQKYYLGSKQTLKLGFWYHVAATFDGKVMKLFINTTLDSSRELDTEVKIAREPGPMVIGAYIGAPGYSVFDGIIDEAAVFDRALTESEISRLAQNMWHTQHNAP